MAQLGVAVFCHRVVDRVDDSTIQSLSPKALLAGLLLSSSHLTTELIHFTAARNDTMALAFALLASIASLKQRPSWMVGLFSLMSLCSKEKWSPIADTTSRSFKSVFDSSIYDQFNFSTGSMVLSTMVRHRTAYQSKYTRGLVNSTAKYDECSILLDSSESKCPNTPRRTPTLAHKSLGLGGLFVYKRASMKNLGLIILFGSFGYTVLTFNQSLLGGFRYLYISYIVGIVLLMTQCKPIWIWFIGSILLCFNVANKHARKNNGPTINLYGKQHIRKHQPHKLPVVHLCNCAQIRWSLQSD